MIADGFAYDENGSRTAAAADPGGAFAERSWRITGRRSLRWCREKLGDNPAYLPIVLRLTPLGIDRRITDRTEVVIEGFPRSGNTFATFAFQEAEGRHVEVASHAHVPAQVKVAVRKRKPTLVVIREPFGCLTSLYSRRHPTCAVRGGHPGVRTPSHHRELLPYRQRLQVIGTFEKTTTDLTSIIGALNRRFGTAFKPFVQTPENVDRVFARIDAHYQEIYGDKASERVAPSVRLTPGRRKEWLTDRAHVPPVPGCSWTKPGRSTTNWSAPEHPLKGAVPTPAAALPVPGTAARNRGGDEQQHSEALLRSVVQRDPQVSAAGQGPAAERVVAGKQRRASGRSRWRPNGSS